jgi:hypothetical protein
MLRFFRGFPQFLLAEYMESNIKMPRLTVLSLRAYTVGSFGTEHQQT